MYEGIEFTACQPFLVFIGVCPSRFADRASFDGVLPDGFLCFFNSPVEVGSADTCCFFIAYRVEGKRLHIIVLISLLLRFESGFIGFIAIEINVVAGGQGMVEACTGCILSSGTSGNEHQSH